MANKKVSQLTSKPSVLVTDLFPIADPSTGQLYKTTISDLGTAIGSGVSSVNGLVGAVVLDTDDIQELVSPTNKWFTDTRARAALSASSPLAYNSGTGVFSIPAATSSQNGYLTSTDWTTFNSKQAALSGTGFVKISGTTISYDNSTYALDSVVVKLTGNQTIAGTKTFSDGIIANATDGNYFLKSEDIEFRNQAIGNSIRIHGTTNSNLAYLYFGSNTSNNIFGFNGTKFTIDGSLDISVNLSASSIIKAGGTSSQFLKADGSVDSSTYLTTGTASSTYLPLSGGTLTGALSGTSATFTSQVYSTKVVNSSTISNTPGDASFLLYAPTTTNYYGGIIGWAEGNLAASISAYDDGSGGALGLSFATGNNTTLSERFKISSTGAATFSSSVNVNQLSINTTATNYKLHVVTTAVAGRQDMTNINRTAANMIRFTNPQYSVEASMGILLRVFPDSDARQGAGIIASGGSLNGETDLDLFVSKDLTTSNSYSALSIKGGSGNVGIGTTAPDTYGANLAVQGSGNGIISVGQGTSYTQFQSNGQDFYLNMKGTGSTVFRNGSGDTERMRITSGGDVLVNSTTNTLGGKLATILNDNGYALSALKQGTFGAGILVRVDNTNSDYIRFFYSSSNTQTGSINTNGTTTTYNVTSDYRLKQDLKPINGLDIVNKIKVYDYEWKSNNTRMDGVLAHELAEVLPYAVTGIKDGEEMQQVDYSKIVPVMVQAIKELKAELDTLKNK